MLQPFPFPWSGLGFCQEANPPVGDGVYLVKKVDVFLLGLWRCGFFRDANSTVPEDAWTPTLSWNLGGCETARNRCWYPDSCWDLHAVIAVSWFNYIWRFPKIGVSPKSSILVGFSLINHPFWGTPIPGNFHMFYIVLWCSMLKSVICDHYPPNPKRPRLFLTCWSY